MDHVDDEFTEVGVEVAGNGEKEEIVEDNVSGVGSAEADHRYQSAGRRRRSRQCSQSAG